jgi:hypothetical protein
MNRSHMPVQHFIAQLDRWKQKRAQRDLRPEWLQNLIGELADLFDPFHEIARAGFECRPVENGWEVGLFLGRMEIVGGRHDGREELCNFSYDLVQLKSYFQTVNEFRMTSLPREEEGEAVSFVLVRGQIESQDVTIRIFSLPPEEAGIGLRKHLNGQCETV